MIGVLTEDNLVCFPAFQGCCGILSALLGEEYEDFSRSVRIGDKETFSSRHSKIEESIVALCSSHLGMQPVRVNSWAMLVNKILLAAKATSLL